jgi:hypothetical protein
MHLPYKQLSQGEHAASHGLGIHLDLTPEASYRQHGTAEGRKGLTFKSPDVSISFLSKLMSSEKQVSQQLYMFRPIRTFN